MTRVYTRLNMVSEVRSVEALFRPWGIRPPDKFNLREGEWDKWLRRWEPYREILFLNRMPEECQVMHLLHAMGEEAEDTAYRVFEDPSDLQDYKKVVEKLSYHFKGKIDVAYKSRNLFALAHGQSEPLDRCIIVLENGEGYKEREGKYVAYNDEN